MSDIFAPGRGPGSCNGNAQVRPCQGGRQRSVASIRHEACGARARAPACVLRALLCSPWFDCHTPSLPHAHSPPNSSDGCGVLPVIGFWIVFFVFLQFCKAQGVTLMSFHLSFLCVFMCVLGMQLQSSECPVRCMAFYSYLTVLRVHIGMEAMHCAGITAHWTITLFILPHTHTHSLLVSL